MHRRHTHTRDRPLRDDAPRSNPDHGAWRGDRGATPSWAPLMGSFAILALMLGLILVLSAVGPDSNDAGLSSLAQLTLHDVPAAAGVRTVPAR